MTDAPAPDPGTRVDKLPPPPELADRPSSASGFHAVSDGQTALLFLDVEPELAKAVPRLIVDRVGNIRVLEPLANARGHASVRFSCPDAVLDAETWFWLATPDGPMRLPAPAVTRHGIELLDPQDPGPAGIEPRPRRWPRVPAPGVTWATSA